MNIKFSAALWLISILILYYLLNEIAIFYLIAGYIFFAINCFRERNFDWQSTFSFGIAWSAGGILGLISIGLLGFVLALVGPLPTVLVFVICSLSFIILGMTYALTKIKLQPDISVPHGLRIGIILFLCALVIGIPMYLFIMNSFLGLTMPQETLKNNIDNFWSYMTAINPTSSQYMEDLIKRQQVTYEQLRVRYEQPMPSLFSRIWNALTDEILTERFEYSLFILKSVVEDAMVKSLIHKADLSAKAWEVMNETQRTEWLISAERDVNDYLQKTGGKRVYPKKGEPIDLEAVFDLGYSPVTDWAIKQAAKSTNVWAFTEKVVERSWQTTGEAITSISPMQEYALIEKYDDRSRLIALLALINSVIFQDAARACEQGSCDDVLIFDRYYLQPGCLDWLRQNRPDICKQNIDEKPWLCDIHSVDADCPRRRDFSLQT